MKSHRPVSTRITRSGSRFPDAMETARRQVEDEIQRGQSITRRSFIRSSGGLFVALTLPLPACNDPSAFIMFLLDALQLVGQAISGDMSFSDPNSRCRAYQLAVDLFDLTDISTGVAVANGLLEFDACSREEIVPLEPAQMFPQQAGDHQLQTRYDGSDWLSDTFGVRT